MTIAGLNSQHIRRLISTKLSQDVLWSVASLGFLAFGGILSNLIIVSLEGVQALGIFNQSYAIFIVLSQIGVGGLQFSVLKHVSYHQKDLSKSSAILFAALLLVGFLAGTISLLAYLCADWITILLDSPEVGTGFMWAIPGLFFFTLNKVLIMFLNGLAYMRAYAIFRSLRFIFLPLAIVCIILSQAPASTLPLALSITELLLFIGLMIYCATIWVLRPLAEIAGWFSKHISYGTRGCLSGILIEMNTRVDVLMLGYFSNDLNVGIYSFAAMLAEGFSQLPLVLRWNFDPIIGSFFSKGQTEQISRFSQRTRKILWPVMLLTGVVAIWVYPYIFSLASSENFVQSGQIVFAIITVGIIGNSGFRPFLGILLQGDRPGTYTLLNLGLLLGNGIFNILLIPYLGLYGAALATMFVYIIEAIALVVYARKYFGVRL